MLFAIALAAGPGPSSSSSSDHRGSGFSSSSQSAAQNEGANQHHQQQGSICLGFADIFIAFVLIVLILATVLGNVLVVLSVFLYKRMRTFTNLLLTSLATADLLVGLLIMPLALLDLLHNHNWPLGIHLCRIWATFDILLCTASILNLCIISLDRYMAITSPLRYPRTRSKWMAAALLCFVWGMSLVVCSPPWFVDEWAIHAVQDKPSMASPQAPGRGGKRAKSVPFSLGPSLASQSSGYQCAYPMSVSYRIYSASCSFYIPLVIMLFVYFKIFRVASERERLIREGMGTCRLSRRVEKTQLKGRKRSATTNYNHRSSVPRIRETIQPICPPSTRSARSFQTDPMEHQNLSNHCSTATNDPSRGSSLNKVPPLSLNHHRFSDERTSSGQMSPNQVANHTSPFPRGECPEDLLSCCSAETSCPPSARNSAKGVDGTNRAVQQAKTVANVAPLGSGCNDSLRRKIKSMECLGNLHRDPAGAGARQSGKFRKNSADPMGENGGYGTAEERKYSAQNLQPPPRALANGGGRQLIRQQNSCSNLKQQQKGINGGGPQQPQFSAKNANLRGSKEKIVYLRERKALKTIGIVVLGFILCWCPFFVVYILEVSPLKERSKLFSKREFQMLAEFFLWLGYSNSVLNPIIYTMYNSDFRRCFRDLLGLGCFQQHRRTMSVKKLHQQSTVF